MPSEKRARQRAAREARLAAEAKRKKQRQRIRNVVIVAVVAAAIVGIAFLVSRGNNKPVSSESSVGTTTTTSATRAADDRLQAQANAVAVKAGCPASTKTRVNDQTYSSAPPMTIDTSKTYTATVDTTTGTFVITLDPASAPHSVNSFVFLAQKGFYHCVIFHRVIPNFMDQSGDPTGTGDGNAGYTIPAENPTKAANAAQQYPVGSVAMAATASGVVSGNQFFIVTGPEGEGLPNSYPLFGQVTSGMNVVQTINQQGNSNPSANGIPPDVTQRILSVTITSS